MATECFWSGSSEMTGDACCRMPIGTFEISAREGRARQGIFHTAHGSFATPAFMPVGTQATVKGVAPWELRELGAEIILANTYHLHLRPGDELIRDLGGLHKFMGWDGPILTDSGGYQVFSLAALRKVTDEEVIFQSHIDGSTVSFTPEKVVRIQENLGVDIMMVLDECLKYGVSEEAAKESWKRTLSWARRSKDARIRKETLIFGIVQGGVYPEVRKQACDELGLLDFDGYAIGGLSVGEPGNLMCEMTDISSARLPEEKIHYLMGVGTPLDIVRAVAQGIDLFDCVMPTRSARFGRLYVEEGWINIRNQEYRNDPGPIEPGCDCRTCRNFSRAYLAHLIHAKEVLAVHLSTVHNLHFYQRVMQEIRKAVTTGNFASYAQEFAKIWRPREGDE